MNDIDTLAQINEQINALKKLVAKDKVKEAKEARLLAVTVRKSEKARITAQILAQKQDRKQARLDVIAILASINVKAKDIASIL